jgi:SAM-dependent methyltransferase
MYGSETADLVVKYYDEAFGISGEAELAWYLSRATACGGPVLDLACGTGRLALLLARDGLEVTAIDRSAGMLNLFREKLKEQPPAISHRIRIENQNLSSFALGTSFNAITCCDSFFHNLSVDEEMSCLRRVARHLAPGGRFLFNLPNPTCEFILKSARSAGADFEEQGRYPLADGSGTLLVEQAHAGHPLEQTITTTLCITRYDPGGKEIEKGESTWTSRYLFRWEAVHLLHRCGFEVESLVGDYTNGPVTEGGQLIFQARLRDQAAH